MVWRQVSTPGAARIGVTNGAQPSLRFTPGGSGGVRQGQDAGGTSGSILRLLAPYVEQKGFDDDTFS